ncbi:MAG: 2-dehydropantoate 2-reductase [Planctomycetota bacterium]|jgi:2-dehydropantoate 2-reductase
MKIAVIGTGAVGGLYGMRIQASGHEVHYLCHSDAAHVAEHGLRLDVDGGEGLVLPQVQVHAEPATLPPCDVVLVALKTTANAALLPQVLPHAVAADGAVVMMQNGYGLESDAAALAPLSRVYACLCFVCAHKVGPGHIRHLDYGPVTIAAHDQRAAAQIGDIVELFAGAGFAATTAASALAARWLKLAWNIPFNGLCTVADCDTGHVLADPTLRARVDALLVEVAQISAAEGAALPDGHLAKMVANTERMVPYLPSMTLDRRAGRALEIDTMFARPLAAAQRHGILAPALTALVAQLRALG